MPYEPKHSKEDAQSSDQQKHKGFVLFDEVTHPCNQNKAEPHSLSRLPFEHASTCQSARCSALSRRWRGWRRTTPAASESERRRRRTEEERRVKAMDRERVRAKTEDRESAKAEDRVRVKAEDRERVRESAKERAIERAIERVSHSLSHRHTTERATTAKKNDTAGDRVSHRLSP